MRLGVAFNPLWLYQLERLVLGNAKPSICCGCHGWRIIALLGTVVTILLIFFFLIFL